jgi:hypothetical protein
MKFLYSCLFALLAASFALAGPAQAPYVATFKMTPQGPLDVLVYPAHGVKAEPTAAIILFHGGGFTAGKPTQFDYYARYFSEQRGVTVLLPEYRLVNLNNGVSLVETVYDAHSIIRLVRHRASVLGIDPDKIVVGGSSVGGQLAAIAATIDGYNDPNDPVPAGTSHSPNLVLALNPPLAVGGTGQWGISKQQADDFTPLKNLDNNAADAWHLTYGSLDSLLSMGEMFSTLAKSNPSYGIQHDRWQMEGASHGFIHLPEYRETVAYYMDLFLKKHGFLSGPPVVFPDPSHQYTLEATTP